MAIKKKISFNQPFGAIIEGEYFVIERYEVDKRNNNTLVYVALYKDQASSKPMQQATDLPGMTIAPTSIANFPFQFPGLDHTRETLYNALKQQPQFEGCEDC